jgi:peroxiredoxin
MTKSKWYLILIALLALVLAGLVTSCSKEDNSTRAPNFTLKTLDGNTVTLSDFRGRPVMLVFWRIACPSCEYQKPFIQGLYDARSKAPLELLTINTGDKPLAVSQYAASSNITFPILLDPGSKVTQAYGIPGVPVTIFIDINGTVQAYKIGPFQSQKELEAGLDTIYPSLIGTPTTEKEE